MTVSLRRACLAIALSVGLLPCSVAAAAPATPPPPGSPAEAALADGSPVSGVISRISGLPERVLFIGNSHTERHGGMDWLVGNFVAAEDPTRPWEAEHRTSSGVTLEYHLQNGAPQRIRKGDWDVVVLQEYLPGIESRTIEPFLDHARRMDAIVEGSGARSVFYMTWPQGRGDWAALDDFVTAHREVEAELGVKVAPVGVAFARAQAERPDLDLIDADAIHATWAGAYLAAAVIYATLFDRSPEGLDYTFGLTEEDAAYLERVAWQSVTDWRAGVPPAR